tara:strand:+ start:492 stop:671 length:180 start_codon:yes stop_codon:yes gene_type:complete
MNYVFDFNAKKKEESFGLNFLIYAKKSSTNWSNWFSIQNGCIPVFLVNDAMTGNINCDF